MLSHQGRFDYADNTISVEIRISFYIIYYSLLCSEISTRLHRINALPRILETLSTSPSSHTLKTTLVMGSNSDSSAELAPPISRTPR